MTTLLALQSVLLGRYSVERELGRGGMATVWLARDLRLDRLVAIKVLRAELAERPEEQERFLHEARMAARLAHPHIVPINAVVSDGAIAAIVMAFVDGETLGARIRRRGPLAAGEAERVLREVGWALGYAHQTGVVHRDLTLENILIERDSGRALLADFGLAAETTGDAGAPVFGTPGFLAPEVIRGEAVTPASDLYALGVIGYTALAGTPPFTGETTGEMLARHLVQPPPDLAAHCHASPRLVNAVLRCLAKDAADRPADATAFLAALERAPEPVAIAPPLVAWFSRWERFRTIYAVAIPMLALPTWLLIWGYFTSGIAGFVRAATFVVAASFTVLPIAAHLAAEVVELRRLRGRGFGVADLRAAWPHWIERLEREHRREGLPPLPGRVIFDLTVIGAAALLMLYVVVSPLLPILMPIDTNLARAILMDWASNVYLAVMTGIGIGLVTPGVRIPPRGLFRRLTSRFWHSRLAGVVGRLAGTGQRHRLAASSTIHRNTELVLALALEDLWKAMPPALRDGLDDVPALGRTLQRSAAELRDLGARLAEAEHNVASHDPDEAARVRSAHEAITARQRETITMLERLRLQLLRTVADRQPTADLDAHLARARELERTLLAELGGHAAVRRLLDRQRSGRHRGSPTPSPAVA